MCLRFWHGHDKFYPYISNTFRGLRVALFLCGAVYHMVHHRCTRLEPYFGVCLEMDGRRMVLGFGVYMSPAVEEGYVP